MEVSQDKKMSCDESDLHGSHSLELIGPRSVTLIRRHGSSVWSARRTVGGYMSRFWNGRWKSAE